MFDSGKFGISSKELEESIVKLKDSVQNLNKILEEKASLELHIKIIEQINQKLKFLLHHVTFRYIPATYIGYNE